MKYEIKRSKVESIKLDLGDVVVTLTEGNISSFTYNRPTHSYRMGDTVIELHNGVVVKFYTGDQDRELLDAISQLFKQKSLK